MKKIIIIFILIILFCSTKGYCAPNYSFSKNGTQQSNTYNSTQTQINKNKNINIYKPNNYIENKISKNDQYDIVEIVIDYSGSMRPWIERAKNVIQQILPQIPPSTHVGLRVFGQKQTKQLLQSNNLFKNVAHNIGGVVGTVNDGCQATEQIVNITPVNSSNMISAMNATQIGSATPLTLALKETIYNDFTSKNTQNKKKIILITDGAESCGQSPCTFIQKVANSRNDIQIDVILINGTFKLKCLADYTGGNFYNVNSTYKFDSALGNSLKRGPQNNYNMPQDYSTPQLHNVNHYQFLSE